MTIVYSLCTLKINKGLTLCLIKVSIGLDDILGVIGEPFTVMMAACV